MSVPSSHFNIPSHVAIIMDGNGRWAKKRKLPRTAGHKAGGETLKKIVRVAGEVGIKYFSVYAFSTENWKRPKDEVNALIKLLVEFCKSQVPELIKTNTKIVFIGDIEGMPEKQRRAMREAEQKTEHCTGLQFNVCINYGGRDEIIHAIKSIMKDTIKLDDINETLIEKHLYTAGIPDPDLLIRTSGELRLSNFYLWQLSYSEFCFVDVHWPDFTKDTLMACIEEYNNRNRRFGNV